MPVSFAPRVFIPHVAALSLRLSLTLAACLAVSACSTLNNATGRVAGLVSPYKVEVVQGNFVSKEQKDALQIGMPRAQVRDILGSPLVTSVFHADRWDYVFTIRRQGAQPQQRKLVVFFKGDELAKVDSDELISEEEFVTSLSANRKFGKVPLLEVPPEVLREFGIKSSTSNTAVASVNTAPNATNLIASPGYPPLEAPGAISSAWDASTLAAAAPAAPVRISAAPAAPALAALAPLLGNAAPTAATAAPPTPLIPITSPASSAAAARPAAAATSSPPATPPTTPPAASAPITSAQANPAAVSPAPAPARPAPTPAPPPQPAPSASTLAAADPDITTFLNRWTSDWQSRNAAAYFSHYAPEFKGTSDSRTEWEAQRRTRIEGRSRMSIAALDVRVRMVSPTEARLVFRQNYESDAFTENGTKAMFLIKRDGRWLIEREFFTPTQ